MNKSSKKFNQLLIGSSIGLVVGAVAAVLLTPKSGRQTRADLKNAKHKLLGNSEVILINLFNRLKNVESDIINNIKQNTGPVQKDLNDILESAKSLRANLRLLISSARDGKVEDSQLKSTILEYDDIIEKFNRAKQQ